MKRGSGAAKKKGTARKSAPPRGSITVGRWKAGTRGGTVIGMTRAGMRWWLAHVPDVRG